MASIASLSTIQSPSGRGAGALGLIIESSELMRALELNSAWTGGVFSGQYEVVDPSSSAPARALNSDFSATDRAAPTLVNYTQAVHGDKVLTDIRILADYESSAAKSALLEKDVRMRVKTFAQAYTARIMNGTGLSNNLKGFKAIIDGTTDIPGFTGVKCYVSAKDATSGADDSCDLSVTANQIAFVEFLTAQLANVDQPNAIVMNSALKSRLTTIAHATRQIATTTDQFGLPITTFAGIPIVTVGTAAIASNEPNANATPVNDTTSLYVFSFGEMRTTLITNSGLYYQDWDHQDNSAKSAEHWEISAAIAIQDKNTALRVAHIKL